MQSAAQRNIPEAIFAAETAHRENTDPSSGFGSFGEFLHQVRAASTSILIDPRLNRAATVYGNEAAGPDGGYAVPVSFASEIASLAYSEASLLPLCSQIEIAGGACDIPKDETTPWGSAGAIAAWELEGNQSAGHKPNLDSSHLKLRKLKVLVPATDELVADSPALGGYLLRTMGSAIAWKVNNAIVNGSAGTPLGILNAPSLIVQAKEASQAPDTIIAANVVNMAGRCILPGNTVWLLNQDAYPQICALNLNGSPLWTPGFTEAAPNGLLLGRPIVLADACQTLGDQGDIILANMSGYGAVTKAGGAMFTSSMHMWFDQDTTAFRLVFRMDGAPLLSAPVTPPNSAKTRSHFVTLAARA